MKKYIFIIIIIFFININVYAVDDIYIDNITIMDKSDDVISKDFNNIDLVFNNLGETVKYKIDIVNNTNNSYVIDSNFKDQYIGVNIRNKKIKKHSTTSIYLDVTYNNLMNKNTKYNINDIIKFKLDKNYTNNIIKKSIIILILIIFIIVFCTIISKIDSIKVFKVIILGILLLPLMSIADNRYLRLEVNIDINYNYLLGRCIYNNTNCINWNKYTYNSKSVNFITKKDKIFKNTYLYNHKIYYLKVLDDVGNNQNKQVLLGKYVSNDNDVLLILGQYNGINLNNNSSYLFYNTKFNTYDLNSFNTSNTFNMSHMFEGVSTSSIDISSFDTYNVTDTSYMFNNSRINDINISNMNVKNLNNTSYMFSNSNINNIIGFLDIDWSNVKYKYNCFINSNNIKFY